MFRFALVDAEFAELIGVVSFAVPDLHEGDEIPRGKGSSLSIVQILESDQEDDSLPVLVVERVD
jgi:hypothetical protein